LTKLVQEDLRSGALFNQLKKKNDISLLLWIQKLVKPQNLGASFLLGIENDHILLVSIN
jgi:hypothetical protein